MVNRVFGIPQSQYEFFQRRRTVQCPNSLDFQNRRDGDVTRTCANINEI